MAFSYEQNLVSRWDMSTINPVDLGFRGLGNDGVGTGLVAATDIVQGRTSMATEFDDATDYVDISNPLSFSAIALGSFSVALWVKAAVLGRQMFVFQGAAAGNQGWWLGWNNIDSSTYFQVMQTGDATHLGVIAAVPAVIDGAWHHYVCTCTVNSRADLYIDGFLAGSDVTPTGVPNPTPAAGLRLHGAWGTWVARACVLDDVRIYSTALTGIDVADLYARSRRGATGG